MCNEKDLLVLFTEAGFSCLTFEKSEVPQQVIDDMLAAEPEDWDDRAGAESLLRREIRYWRVSSDVGAFGFMVAVFPALDLYGTGLTARDLMEEPAGESAELAEVIESFEGVEEVEIDIGVIGDLGEADGWEEPLPDPPDPLPYIVPLIPDASLFARLRQLLVRKRAEKS